MYSIIKKKTYRKISKNQKIVGFIKNIRVNKHNETIIRK